MNLISRLIRVKESRFSFPLLKLPGASQTLRAAGRDAGSPVSLPLLRDHLSSSPAWLSGG